MKNTPSYFKNITGLNYFQNFLLTESPLEFEYHSKYLNLREDIFKSVKPWFTALINNYKVLLYNGNLDIIVALPLTENFLKNLGKV
jgi:vitellogenic carboxypeptidase-like protein